MIENQEQYSATMTTREQLWVKKEQLLSEVRSARRAIGELDKMLYDYDKRQVAAKPLKKHSCGD